MTLTNAQKIGSKVKEVFKIEPIISPWTLYKGFLGVKVCVSYNEPLKSKD